MNVHFAYLSSAELTDIGRRRKNNEDSMISLSESGVFCVADGMGGVQGGEVASKAVVDALRKAFLELPEAAFAVTAEGSATVFELALNEASRWIKNRADAWGIHGTGSTVVGLVFDRVMPSKGIVLHAGDSRAYRLRDGNLEQLTTDHSIAAAAGLSDDSTLPPMFRGVITHAVGLDQKVSLESAHFDVAAGDIFLLCSDGLDKMLSDHRIRKIIRRHQFDALEQIAKCLVDEAVHAGGDDNVTVIVIRVASNLPLGSTMEIPQETLALEQRVVADPEADELASWRDALGGASERVNLVGDRLAGARVFSGMPSEWRGWVRSRPEIKRTVIPSGGGKLWVWLLFTFVIAGGVGAFLLWNKW